MIEGEEEVGSDNLELFITKQKRKLMMLFSFPTPE